MTAFYQHLRNKGFRESRGIPRVFQVPITINLTTGQEEYDIEEKSSVERNYAVGLWVNDPESTAQNATSSKTVATAAVFNACYLVIRKDDQEILRKLPLRMIKKVNDNGHPYYLQIGERINLSESKLFIYNASAIGSDEVIEIYVDYVKPA